MKLKGLLIPDCVLELFYQWCDITGYSKVESNFMVFIEDAALHWNSLNIGNLVIFPLDILVENNYILKIKSMYKSKVLYSIIDTDLDFVFLGKYKKYLDEIRERNGTGVL